MATWHDAGLRALACACAAGALSLCPGIAAAGAAVSIGQLDPGTPTGSCAGTSGWVQSAEAGAPSYLVPAGPWVLVSWSHRARAVAGRELGVRVWRATAVAGSYARVGGGALRIVAPGGINTFYERIPVTGGDVLGLRVGNPPGPFPDLGGGASCAFAAAAGDAVRYGVAGGEPAPGSIAVLPAALAPQRLNVTAVLEADADGDGYGDETQDGCPQTAGPAAGCVPPAAEPEPDATAPTASLGRRRDSIRDGRIRVWVVASEAVTVVARGRVRIPARSGAHRLRSVTAHADAHRRTRVTLRMSRRTRRAAAAALRRGRRPWARIRVTLRDRAGNAGSARRSVRLVR